MKSLKLSQRENLKKTNTRKGHSSYRCTQGDYGEAKKYSPHDMRQLQKMSNEDFDND